MTRNRSGWNVGVFALVVLGVWSTPGPVDAQGTNQPPDRPSQGLFRGDQPDTVSRESLALTGSLSGAFDSHLGGPDASDPSGEGAVKANAFYSTAKAGLAYNKRTNRFTFGSNVDTMFAYYPSVTWGVRQPINSYQGRVNTSAALGHTLLRAAQTVAHQPYFVLEAVPSVYFDSPLVPAAGPAFSPELSILAEPATTYLTDVSFTAPLGRRTSLGLSYGYHGGSYSGALGGITTQSAGVQLTRAVARSTEIHGNYSYQQAAYDRLTPVNRDTIGHSAELGFSHTRRLSASRSLRVNAGAGGSVLDGQFSRATSDRTSRQATAHTGLEVQLGRSWTAEGEFRRSLQLFHGLAQPYFGNAVSFTVHGGLSRRFDLAGAGSYSQGAVGFEAGSNGYDTRRGSVRLRYAISRHFALSTEYINSEYNFGSDTVLPTGVVKRLNRHAVHVGLTWGMSILGSPARR